MNPTPEQIERSRRSEAKFGHRFRWWEKIETPEDIKDAICRVAVEANHAALLWLLAKAEEAHPEDEEC